MEIATQRITLLIWPLPHAARLAARVSGRLRGLLLKLRIVAIGGEVGVRLSADPRVRLITSKGAKLCLGDRVSLGTGVIISLGGAAKVVIGHDVRITHYTLIAAESSLQIADRVQIGEHSSIRDHEHDAAAASMHGAPLVCSPVTIGEDAWIGRGVAVLKGSHIESGAVIGANAVVRDDIPQNGVAVGVPARVVRIRSIQE